MALFGDNEKKETVAPSDRPEIPIQQDVTPAPSGVPFDQVNNMKAQGMTDNQIVQTLQRDGYKSYQIFDALNQADLVPAPAQAPQQQAMPLDPLGQPMLEQQPQDFQQFQPQQSPIPQEPAMQPEPQAYPAFQQEVAQQAPAIDENELDRMEEIAEAIIDEKWNELMKNFKKIVDWKERVETKMEGIQKQLDDLKSSMDGLNNSLIQRMGEYDRNMAAVGTDVKAMEKVFQKMLPTFTENISELNRIAKDMKK